MELCCGPLDGAQVQQEIPFLCSIVRSGCCERIGVMYGVGCRIEWGELWGEKKIQIQTAYLDEWIADSIRRGVYSPGDSDLFIFDHDRLTVRLCHESDIHVDSAEPELNRKCTTRWIEKGFRVQRKRFSAGKGWKDVWCVDDVLSALESHD
jgi:hypothetical protein